MSDTVLILEKLGCTVNAVGSRVTCSPPPMDTDEDYLVEAPTPAVFVEAIDVLLQRDFHRESLPKYATLQGFISWRAAKVNILLTVDPVFAQKFRLATATAKALNLMKRDDRITLFQAILYGNSPKSEK